MNINSLGNHFGLVLAGRPNPGACPDADLCAALRSREENWAERFYFILFHLIMCESNSTEGIKNTQTQAMAFFLLFSLYFPPSPSYILFSLHLPLSRLSLSSLPLSFLLLCLSYHTNYFQITQYCVLWSLFVVILSLFASMKHCWCQR